MYPDRTDTATLDTDLIPFDRIQVDRGLDLMCFVDTAEYPGTGMRRHLRLYRSAADNTLHWAFDESADYTAYTGGPFAADHPAYELNTDTARGLHAALAAVGQVDPIQGDLIAEAVRLNDPHQLVAAVTLDDYAGWGFDYSPDYTLELLDTITRPAIARYPDGDDKVTLETYLHVPTGTRMYRVARYCRCCGMNFVTSLDELTAIVEPDHETEYDRVRRTF